MLARRFLRLVVVGAVVVLATAATAYATFTAAGSASQTISTQTLLAPTAPSATLTSQCNKNKAQVVTVAWTASASTFTTGYTIERDGVTVGTAPAGATSYVDNTVGHSTAYTYTVLATYKQWSTGVTAAAVTTC
jgi:hypothetical protein